MAYVSIPNDLSKIKTKLAFNLTSRQLVCFGCGAAIAFRIWWEQANLRAHPFGIYGCSLGKRTGC